MNERNNIINTLKLNTMLHNTSESIDYLVTMVRHDKKGAVIEKLENYQMSEDSMRVKQSYFYSNMINKALDYFQAEPITKEVPELTTTPNYSININLHKAKKSIDDICIIGSCCSELRKKNAVLDTRLKELDNYLQDIWEQVTKAHFK